MLLQQPALQAAFAAQCMAAQAQSKLQLLPKSSGVQGQVSSQEGDASSVNSQDLSVAQMMMTLARASSKNLHNGDNSGQPPNTQLDASRITK